MTTQLAWNIVVLLLLVVLFWRTRSRPAPTPAPAPEAKTIREEQTAPFLPGGIFDSPSIFGPRSDWSVIGVDEECQRCGKTVPSWFREKLPAIGWLCLHCESGGRARYPLAEESEDDYVAQRGFEARSNEAVDDEACHRCGIEVSPELRGAMPLLCWHCRPLIASLAERSIAAAERVDGSCSTNAGHEEIYLYPWELDSIDEYSIHPISVWKGRFEDHDKGTCWVVCAATESQEVRTFDVVLLSGPKPHSTLGRKFDYFPPRDWESWLRERRRLESP